MVSAMWQSRLCRSLPTLPSLSGELLGWGWVVRSTVWAITAFITAFLVTLQANAMWKRLGHGSQVLNTATPPAVAVIPPAVRDPQQLPSLFPPQALLSGAKRGGRKREGGGGRDYLGVKDRMWATKGEFFGPTSFQSTICAWTATEFKQRCQTKLRYREVRAAFTEKKKKYHMIGRRYSEGGQVRLAQKLRINQVVHKALAAGGRKKKLKKKEKPIIGQRRV